MAKWFGKVGYAQESVEDPQNEGSYEDVIVERSYYGDVIRNTRRLVGENEVLPDITTNNQISILADPYALQNFFAMRYVEWEGALWVVSNVDVQRPRLILSLGVRYNGPKPKPSGDTTQGSQETEAPQPSESHIGW